MREEDGALGGLEGQVGVGALEKVKKGKRHRGETSRSKGVVLGSLAVCTPLHGSQGAWARYPTSVPHLSYGGNNRIIGQVERDCM